MTEVRICWAYNADGQRCDHPAGHPGNHVVMKTWTDEECFSPIVHQLPNPTQVHMNPPLSTKTAPAQLVLQENCVACGHKHRGKECGCNCYEFIG